MSRTKFLAMVILIGVLSLVSIGIVSLRLVAAQNENTNDMQGLLERLSKRMDDGSGFRFFITFVHPLVGDESTWQIGDPADETLLRIIETGKDYVCFREIAGAADGRRCTPFTNIVSVTYINN